MIHRRIAMWSGPRSLSTAMMRAWESRGDTAVVDEPLYAAYLAATGAQHPMRDRILASQPTDWRTVVDELVRGTPAGVRAGDRILYQKHMATHLLPAMERDWLDRLDHVLLLREPRRMIASYARHKTVAMTTELGFVQLREIFERVADRRGTPPPVVAIEDVQRTPRPVLEALCASLEVPFSERMLSWPAGRRSTDGVWAEHWYREVDRTTGWSPPLDAPVDIPESQRAVEEACRPHYQALRRHRLRPLTEPSKGA